MSWNHRVMKTANPFGDEYVIAEVYYNEQDDGTEVIEGWAIGTDDYRGMKPWGDSVEELHWVLQRMIEACDKPVLDEAELLARVEQDERNKPPSDS